MYRRIIGGKRVCGKSTELIKMSHMFEIPIMAPSFDRARYLERMANKMKLTIPDVIAPCDLEHIPISTRKRTRVLVDDIEDIFAALTNMSIVIASTSMEFKGMEVKGE